MKRTEKDDRRKQRTTSRVQRTDERQSQSAERGLLETLQATAGNRACQHLAETDDVQATLSISDPGDPAEQTARRVAESVTRPSILHSDDRAPNGAVETAAGATATIHRQSTSGTSQPTSTPTETPSVTHRGERLPAHTRSVFESRLGRDYTDVRIHRGPTADRAASAIDADAFTYGSDVVFADGAYQPDTVSGQRLLAHELVHVKQQDASDGQRIHRAMGGRAASRELGNSPGGSGQPLEAADSAASIGGTAWKMIENFGLGAQRIVESWGVTGFDRSAEIGAENERAISLLGDLVKAGTSASGPLYQLVRFTAEHELHEIVADELSEEQKAMIRRHARNVGGEAAQSVVEYLVGRKIGKTVVKKVITRLVARVAATAAYKQLAKKIGVSTAASSTGIGFPIGATFMMGTLQRASNASRSLRESNPTLYRTLRRRNLDMGYFLVKPIVPELRDQLRDAALQAIAEELAEARESAEERENAGDAESTTESGSGTAGADGESEEIQYREVGGATIHVIEKGDTLWELGKRYGVDPDRLEELNDVEPRNLQIGEPLLIPEPEPLIVY